MTPCRVTVVAALFLAAASTACAVEESGRVAVLTPSEGFVTTDAISTHVALVSEDVACLPDSYGFRVLCYHRSGELVGAWGSEGEGPGEFDGAFSVRRWKDGQVAVFDRPRMTVFEPTGEMVAEFRAPGLLPHTVDGTRALGYQSPPGRLVEMDLATGSTLWERDYRAISAAGTECGRKRQGAPTPDGGWIFSACDRELLFLRHRDDVRGVVVRTPNYVPELPNARDMAIQRSTVESPQFAGALGMPPPGREEQYLRDFASRPKRWFLSASGAIRSDAHHRIWIGTRRDRSSVSYIDIWTGTEYLGSAQVRDRLIGFDILGSTMVAVVMRPPDPDGVAWHAIDWYDTADVPWGLKMNFSEPLGGP